MDAAAPRVLVIIDYQNIHLTAHYRYAPPKLALHQTLIHPGRFARTLVQRRAELQRDPRQQAAVLTDVWMYRGLPSNNRQPHLYAGSQAQKAEWERDPKVKVNYRPLRYPDDWPDRPAQEKGIDVLVAVNMIAATKDHSHDVVILAAHDTDQEPALEMAAKVNHAKIETAGWEGCRRLRFPGSKLWHTTLDAYDFLNSRDRRDYSHYFTS